MNMRECVITWLEEQVPSPRLKHILRVEQMCGELAIHHQLDVEKARTAGLMHDLAKYFSSERLLAMARQEGLEIDEILACEPHLMHADIGAIVARDEFGIQDPEILEAIANHTLGKPEMSELSCVVYLADSLEPGRGKSQELTTLRQLCMEDLHKALWRTSEYCLHHQIERQRPIHPRTVMTRNWALKQTQKRDSPDGDRFASRSERGSKSDRISA